MRNGPLSVSVLALVVTEITVFPAGSLSAILPSRVMNAICPALVASASGVPKSSLVERQDGNLDICAGMGAVACASRVGMGRGVVLGSGEGTTSVRVGAAVRVGNMADCVGMGLRKLHADNASSPATTKKYFVRLKLAVTLLLIVMPTPQITDRLKLSVLMNMSIS